VWKPAAEYGPEVIKDVGSGTAQTRFRLFCIVEDAARLEEILIDMPLEDLIRPPWYSSVWFNKAIGGAVYDKFFGTTAITDPLIIGDYLPETTGVSPTQEQKAKSKLTIKEQTAQELSAASDVPDEEDYRLDVSVMGEIEQNASIEQSIDFLSYIYSRMRAGRYDIDEFIRGYTWRPVASITDMFGTPDLEYEEGVGGRVEVSQGVEGFHSRAFGDYKNLFGLVGPEVGKVIGVDNQFDPAAARLDVRRERWLAARAYAAELVSQALLG